MARLNEPAMSADTFETLRRRMIRQNRELAKSNNIRALRIRELENECACMLSENLELRGRILELEKQAEDNDSRRIADHALAIKAKLESQLTEWGTLLAGLGLEPPMKKHSPHIRRSRGSRLSFSSARPSPSHRRLRDVARDIEELGHISETKRMSMNPEQILALRSEADSAGSPDLGPPPKSDFINEEPVKVDSPSRAPATKTMMSSPKRYIEPPQSLQSPKAKEPSQPYPSPAKKTAELNREFEQEAPPPSAAANVKKPVGEPKAAVPQKPANQSSQPVKTGTKRKFAAKEDATTSGLSLKAIEENQRPRTFAEKSSIRERAGGKTLKEMANIRKETRERTSESMPARKPLASKSTNDDVASPKKRAAKPAKPDDAARGKKFVDQSKPSIDRSKPKVKDQPVRIETLPNSNMAPPETAIITPGDLAAPLTEPALLSPNSPDPQLNEEDPARGDTPPPAHITSDGETSRPSRRNRTAVSYAEPNLRDKMRRPSKQLFDAVSGEGKYARRASQCEPSTAEKEVGVKHEGDGSDSWRQLPVAGNDEFKPEPGSIPASPLARKNSVPDELPNSVVTERRKRRSSVVPKPLELGNREYSTLQDTYGGDAVDPRSNEPSSVDLYEFTDSSPRVEDTEATDGKRRNGTRPSRSTRKSSAAVESDLGNAVKERSSSRRKSMMV